MNLDAFSWETVAPMMPFVVITIAGLIAKKWPPKEINSLYGYRTKRSMKSQQHWDFAQRYCAHLLSAWGGAALLGMSLQRLVMPPDASHLTMYTSIALLVIILAGMIYFTERELKRL